MGGYVVRMWKLAAIALGFFFSVAGCTRGSNKSGTVALKFKTAESLSTMSSSLAHVVINVSGGNLKQPVFFQWDQHDCGENASCPIPPYWEIKDIPSGGSVYIQVLTVYEDDDTEALTFKYADANKAINTGTNEISMTPVSIGSSTKEAHFYGRYLDRIVNGSPSGPTGVMEARFKPPASVSVNPNPPAITIMRNPIFAGWLNLMALDGDAKFDYYVNGTLLLANVDIAFLQSKAVGSNALLQVDVPDYERTRYESGGSSGRQLEKAQKIFIGYLGPQVTTEKACYNGTGGGAITDAFVAGSNGGTTLQWNGTTHSASNPNEATPEFGGVAFTPSDGTPCDLKANEYIDHIVFDFFQLKNGHDSVAGIRGPFRPATSFGDYVNATSTNGVGLNIDVNFLPGVTVSGGINGIIVYQRAGNTSEDGLYGSGDGIQCSTLTNKGFTVLADIGIAVNQTSLRVSIPHASNVNNNGYVVCPRSPAGVIDSGVKIHSVRQAASFKLVGTHANSQPGPGFSPGMQLLKSSFLNGYHYVVAQAGSQYPNGSALAGIYASVDEGPWFPIAITSSIPLAGAGSVAGTNTGPTNSALYTQLNNGSSQSVRFKFELASWALGTYGYDYAQMISEPIRLIGGNDCGSPGTISPFNLDYPTKPNQWFTAADLVNLVDSSDRNRFQLRYPGCTGANWAAAVPDYVTISGSSCFSMMDIERPTALEIQIDPKDIMQSNCSLSGATVTFAAISNAGEVFVPSTSGKTILHSTVPAGLALVPSATSLSAIDDIGFFYDLALVGSTQGFTANAFKVNQDRKLTSATAMASGSTSWSSFLDWLVADSPLGQLLTITGKSGPVPGPTRQMTAMDGSVKGGFALGVQNMGNVIAASSGSVDMGSSLMLVDNGTTIKMAYVPAANGDFSNQNVRYFSLPADIAPFSGSAAAYIHYIPLNMERYVFVALQGGSTSHFAYGRILGTGASMSIDWAPSVSSASDLLRDVQVALTSSSYPRIIIAHRLGGNDYLMNVTPPTKTGAWSGNALGSTVSYDLTANSYTGIIGFAMCSSYEPWAIVRYSTNTYFLQLDVDTWTPTSRGNTGADTSAHDRAACKIAFGGGYVLLSYSTTTNSIYSMALDDGANTCGAGGGAFASLSWSPTMPTPTSGGFRTVFDSSDGLNFVYDSGGRTVVKAVNPTCSGGTMTFNAVASGKMTAQLNTNAASINGAAVFTGSFNPGAGLILYGNNSQYYQLRSR